MSDGAGKGPRVRPLDGSSVHRSTAGGLSARAAGGKGFGMLGHTGSHGRSMVARVRSAAGGCLDTFSRTVAGGWGNPGWCFGDWTMTETSVASVNGSAGVVAIPEAGSYWNGGRLTYPAEVHPTGDYLFRARRGDPGGFPADVYEGWSRRDHWLGVQATIIPTYLGDSEQGLQSPGHPLAQPGMVAFCALATGFVSSSNWLQIWVADGRWSSGLTTYNDGYRACVAEEFWTHWWYFRLHVDAYGTYARFWRDDESETAYPSSVSTADVFGGGSPQGGGELWSAWSAVAAETPMDQDYPCTWLWMQAEASIPWDVWPDLTTYVDFDDVTLTGALCPCV